MFEVGDIVRPEGYSYWFHISDLVTTTRDRTNFYSLKRIEEILDPQKGPLNKQLEIIESVERKVWSENALERFETIPDTAVKLSDELMKWANISIDLAENSLHDDTIDSLSYALTKQNKTNKEENIMDILDLYEERKLKFIREEYSESEKNVKENDEIQKIIIEMTNQVNTILENQGTEARYAHLPSLYTPETVEKLDELGKKRCETIEKLRSTLEEIRALFEMTDDYHERIKILKDYNILDKKGKLNV